MAISKHVNISVYDCLNAGSESKSESEAQRLVDEVLRARDFNASDLHGTQFGAKTGSSTCQRSLSNC
jgi:hypothetical protein